MCWGGIICACVSLFRLVKYGVCDDCDVGMLEMRLYESPQCVCMCFGRAKFVLGPLVAQQCHKGIALILYTGLQLMINFNINYFIKM